MLSQKQKIGHIQWKQSIHCVNVIADVKKKIEVVSLKRNLRKNKNWLIWYAWLH